MLDQEFKYYIDNQDELVEKYDGKYIVIKGNEVIGAYDSDLAAYMETKKKHALGTFLIQLCGPGEENYTQTFHSLAVFELISKYESSPMITGRKALFALFE